MQIGVDETNIKRMKYFQQRPMVYSRSNIFLQLLIIIKPVNKTGKIMK